MAEPNNQNHPKVFLSYSWKSEEYKKRVLNLATRLRRDGVDVILDRWHLKYGMNRFFFMETNIRNCDRVLILCEEKYTEKADSKDGSGVGIETNVITPEVYGKNDQQKFIPVIMEDPISLPMYLKGCLAVDYRSDDGYENILRAAYGVGMDEIPPMKGTPEFIQRLLSVRMNKTPETNETYASEHLASPSSPIEKPANDSTRIEVDQKKENSIVGKKQAVSIQLKEKKTSLMPSTETSAAPQKVNGGNKPVNYETQPQKSGSSTSTEITPIEKYWMLKNYEKELEKSKKTKRSEDLDTAAIYDKIAQLYFELMNYDKALENYKKALAIREKLLKRGHIDILRTYRNIANAFEANGDYPNSIFYRKRDVLR